MLFVIMAQNNIQPTFLEEIMSLMKSFPEKIYRQICIIVEFVPSTKIN